MASKQRNRKRPWDRTLLLPFARTAVVIGFVVFIMCRRSLKPQATKTTASFSMRVPLTWFLSGMGGGLSKICCLHRAGPWGKPRIPHPGDKQLLFLFLVLPPVHTTRFDIHYPYRLYAHPLIPGALGVVLPGTTIHVGKLMVAAQSINPAPSSSIAENLGAASSSSSSSSTTSTRTSVTSSHHVTAEEGSCMLRMARPEDVGVVHRVVVSNGNEGIVYTSSQRAYSLHNWALVRGAISVPIPAPGSGAAVFIRTAPPHPKGMHLHSVKRGGGNMKTAGASVTVRITTVSLREVRVGDKFASRHGLCI